MHTSSKHPHRELVRREAPAKDHPRTSAIAVSAILHNSNAQTPGIHRVDPFLPSSSWNCSSSQRSLRISPSIPLGLLSLVPCTSCVFPTPSRNGMNFSLEIIRCQRQQLLCCSWSLEFPTMERRHHGWRKLSGPSWISLNPPPEALQPWLGTIQISWRKSSPTVSSACLTPTGRRMFNVSQ